jgi:hypothetical protein
MPENTTTDLIESSRQLTISGTVAVDQPETRRYGTVTFAPREVALDFRRPAGKAWMPQRVTIAGPNIKKDGSTGANVHDNSYWFADYSMDWSGDAPPRWALDLVEAHLRELNAPVYDTPETVEAKFKQAAMVMNAARSAVSGSSGLSEQKR